MIKRTNRQIFVGKIDFYDKLNDDEEEFFAMASFRMNRHNWQRTINAIRPNLPFVLCRLVVVPLLFDRFPPNNTNKTMFSNKIRNEINESIDSNVIAGKITRPRFHVH